MFQLHEEIFPVYIGLSEHVAHALYFVIIFAYLYCFRVKILQFDYVLLVAAFFLFGIHELTDLLREWIFNGEDGLWSVFIEDGAKFIGIGFWLAFFSTVSFKTVIAHFNLRNQLTEQESDTVG
jgi:hypothetical protein